MFILNIFIDSKFILTRSNPDCWNENLKFVRALFLVYDNMFKIIYESEESLVKDFVVSLILYCPCTGGNPGSRGVLYEYK